jgi:precorrin-3B methylase
VESVWAAASIWSQITVRLRMMATARFMVLIYNAYH